MLEGLKGIQEWQGQGYSVQVAIVALDKQDCINKAHDLLAQSNTYEPLMTDLTKNENTKTNS